MLIPKAAAQQKMQQHQLYADDPDAAHAVDSNQNTRVDGSTAGAAAEVAPPPPLTDDEARRARSSVVVLAIGGLLAGYVIGIVAVIMAFYKSVMDVACSAAVSPSTCAWLAGPPGSEACRWLPHRSVCVTAGAVGQLCVAAGNASAGLCANLTSAMFNGASVNVSCHWLAPAGACVDSIGPRKAAVWSASENGAIAAMMIAGGFLGSFAARRYLGTALRVVRALQWIGVISVVSCVFHTGGWLAAAFGARFGLLVFGRLFPLRSFLVFQRS